MTRRLYTSEEAKQRNRENAKAYAKNLKIVALKAYGSQCSCCGETEPLFLELDHGLQDGAKFRKEYSISSGTAFLNWLKNHGWPQDLGLQVLCANCHLAKDYRGGCPHKGEYVKPCVGRPLKS